VLTAEGFDVEVTGIFTPAVPCGSDPGNTQPTCNSWGGGHFNIAGVVAVADTADTPFENPVDIDVLLNDTGFVDSVSVSLPGGGTSANGGSVLINGTNPGPQGSIDITYTPLAGFSGPDTFEYTVADGTNSGTATVTVDVLFGSNPDTASTHLNTQVNIPIGENDGGFIDPVTVTITVPPDNGGSVDMINGSGGPMNTVTIDFTPVAAPGTATYTETFTYEVTDSMGTVDTAVVTVTVTNELPIAVAATETVGAGTKVTTDVATLPGINLGDAPSVITATGSTSVAGTVITYTAGLLPGSDSYDYTITDVDGETSTATVDVTITGGGGVPGVPQGVKANPDETTVLQGESVDINVTLNDQPGSGALADHTVAVTTAPTNGSTSVDDETNVVTYTPNQGFNGVDSFNYTLRDEDENISITSVTVTVKQFVKLPSASAIGPWSLILLLLAPWLRRRRT